MKSEGKDPEHGVLMGKENKQMIKTKRANRAGEVCMDSPIDQPISEPLRAYLPGQA